MKKITIPLEEWEKVKKEAKQWRTLYGFFTSSDYIKGSSLPVVCEEEIFMVKYLGPAPEEKIV